MAIELTLPELGEGIDEADVTGVLVAVGDTVDIDQGLIEIETDKASVEVPATSAGTVTAVHVKNGDTIRVGAPIVTVDVAEAATPATTDAADPPTAAAQEPPADAPDREAVDRDGDTEGAPEDAPALNPPGTTEAGDAPPAAPSRAEVEESGGATSEAAAAPAAPAAPAPSASAAGDGRTPVAASPSTRRFAREIGVEIERVPGSGPGGRITEEDVKGYARSTRGVGATSGGVPAPGALPDLERYGPTEREQMSRVRRTTAATLAQSWIQSPHVTIQQKADITELEALRQRLKPRAQAAGTSLTVLAILTKVVAMGLRQHPKLNAALDMQHADVVYRRSSHVGIAVDTPRGLLVPVIRDAAERTILEIAADISHLATKARDGSITIEEMRGGTITISNLGPFGTGFFTPIINPPEVAILGVGRSEMEPVYIDGTFEPRLRLPLSLSFDHRLVDGVDGTRFLNWVVEALQEPLLVMM